MKMPKKKIACRINIVFAPLAVALAVFDLAFFHSRHGIARHRGRTARQPEKHTTKNKTVYVPALIICARR